MSDSPNVIPICEWCGNLLYSDPENFYCRHEERHYKYQMAVQAARIASLEVVIGNETPIDGLTLYQSWKAEKQHMMEYIAELQVQLDPDVDTPEWDFQECMRQYDHQQERACNAEARIADLQADLAEMKLKQEEREYNLTCRALDTTPEGREFLAKLTEAQAENVTLTNRVNDLGGMTAVQWQAECERIGEELAQVKAENAALREANRWIHNSEEIAPDNDQLCLVYADGVYMATFQDGIWWESPEYTLDEVEFWRPLPPLPSSGQVTP